MVAIYGITAYLDSIACVFFVKLCTSFYEESHYKSS